MQALTRYSVRRIRGEKLRDGTPGHLFAKEFSKSRWLFELSKHRLQYDWFRRVQALYHPARARAAVGGRVPLLYRLQRAQALNLQAFPNLAAQTTKWLLAAYGHEDVAMPREKSVDDAPLHLLRARALDAAERSCGGIDLASMPSPHSNRIAIRNTAKAANLMRLWLNATQDEGTYLPAPTRKGGRWHTPEQCSFGLIDACRHGRDEVWFEYFYTRHHARLLDLGSYWGNSRRPALLRAREYINVARTRSPTLTIEHEHRWGRSLDAVAKALPPEPEGLVDACLVFPRLNDVRHTKHTDLQCPNVLYKRANDTTFVFAESREKPFKARPL